MVILDTDTMSILERGGGDSRQRLSDRLRTLAPGEVVTTIITYEEQIRGWMAFLAKARLLQDQVRAYHRLNQHLDNYRSIIVLEFDDAAASSNSSASRNPAFGWARWT